MIRDSRPDPGLLSVCFTRPSAVPPTPSLLARVLQIWGSARLLTLVGWGRLGALGVMGCVVTQSPILFSFVEREKGVGVIYQIGFSRFYV